MSRPAYTHTHFCPASTPHYHVCRRQIEVEVYPPNAEVYFADERHIDPVNTQIRFTASVYNANNNNVNWQLTKLDGSPGLGSIDNSGLYLAPQKGVIPHGTTVLVIATVKSDPTRRAYAKITLIGEGPEPTPVAKLEIYPWLSHLYYQAGAGFHNHYMDHSNKHQQFRSLISNTTLSDITWNTTSGPGVINNNGFYTAPGNGFSSTTVDITAQLTHDNSVKCEARIILLNYFWPGIS